MGSQYLSIRRHMFMCLYCFVLFVKFWIRRRNRTRLRRARRVGWLVDTVICFLSAKHEMWWHDCPESDTVQNQMFAQANRGHRTNHRWVDTAVFSECPKGKVGYACRAEYLIWPLTAMWRVRLGSLRFCCLLYTEDLAKIPNNWEYPTSRYSLHGRLTRGDEHTY